MYGAQVFVSSSSQKNGLPVVSIYLKMKRTLRKLLPGDNTRMVVIASLIGVMAGLCNIVFRESVRYCRIVFMDQGSDLLGIDQGGWHLLLLPLIPMTGVALLIPLAYFFPGEVNGYGFPKFLKKVNLEGGYIKGRTIVLKIVSTALTVGSGNSAGVEGPIAQIGGAAGAQVGQFSRVSGTRMKVYIAAGCAGGIAGMFNAPLAGIFFASEIVLLGTFEISSFAALVIASAISTMVTRAYFGETSIFHIPDYQIVNYLVEVPLYSIMAVFIGLLAAFYIHVFYRIRDIWNEFTLHPFLKPIAGAFLVGVMGIGFPEILGGGYESIAQVLHNHGILWVMFCLIFLKIFATAITLGSGGAGGVFAPALFIGAMSGGTFGAVVNKIMPTMTATPGAYATIGIGAFLAASTHAPMTAIFLLFELTGNYQVIIPIMVSAIIGTVVATKFKQDSIDTVDFSRAGIDIHEGREAAIMQSVKVGKALTEDVDFISEEANAQHLIQVFMNAKTSFYFPVIDETGKMTGIVSLQDVKNILQHDEKERLNWKVGDICNRDVITLTPNDSLYTAMELFDIKGIEEIPVVEDLKERWVIGMLQRRNVIAVYNHEALKKGISAKTNPAIR